MKKRSFHWFWAPVREGESWAQTFIRVLGNLFRITLTLAIALAAALAVTAYFQGDDSRRREREARLIVVEAQKAMRARAAVADYSEEELARIASGEPSCPVEFPIAVVVRNNSSLTLMSMDIEVSARLPGTSTNLLNYGERTIRWDHIVPPQYVLGMCYRVGRDSVDSSAIYSAAAISYSMVLQPTEDWMLQETQGFKSAAGLFDDLGAPPTAAEKAGPPSE